MAWWRASGGTPAREDRPGSVPSSHDLEHGVPRPIEASRHVAGRGLIVDDDAQNDAWRKRFKHQARLEDRVGAHLAPEIQLLDGALAYFSTGRVGVLPHSIHDPS